nr:hypothetical protein [Tanacetum cinerariifolium]
VGGLGETAEVGVVAAGVVVLTRWSGWVDEEMGMAWIWWPTGGQNLVENRGGARK